MALSTISLAAAQGEIQSGKITQWRCCPHPSAVLDTEKQGQPIDTNKYGYSLALVRYGKEYLFLCNDEGIMRFDSETAVTEQALALGCEPHAK